MQTTAPSKQQTFYVHKLRLEVNEGARVDIIPLAAPARSYQGGWIVAKFIAASAAVFSLLTIAARELAR